MDIHINKDGQQCGPYTLDQVNEYLAQGSLSATDPAWHDGLAGWVPLNQISGVVDASSSAPPAFDPAAFNPNAAAPPAVAQSDVPSLTPDVPPVVVGAATCPGCQAPVDPEMLFCGACGQDLQADWQVKKVQQPAGTPQAEGSVDSGLPVEHGPSKGNSPRKKPQKNTGSSNSGWDLSDVILTVLVVIGIVGTLVAIYHLTSKENVGVSLWNIFAVITWLVFYFRIASATADLFKKDRPSWEWNNTRVAVVIIILIAAIISYFMNK